MNDNENEKKKIDLLPLCAAFNYLQLYADGSVAINIALVESWIVSEDGRVHVTMQSGQIFLLTPEQADELVSATRRALDQAARQVKDQQRLVVPAVPRGM